MYGEPIASNYKDCSHGSVRRSVMINREKPRSRPNELRTLEELAKEKERIRKQQQTRNELDVYDYRAYDYEYDPLLEALIKEHPEKDPANTK
jgi:hypothetical protein